MNLPEVPANAWSSILSVLLHVTAVLAGCWFASRLLRKKSATLVHGICVAGWIGILLLPVSGYLATPWEIPVATISSPTNARVPAKVHGTELESGTADVVAESAEFDSSEPQAVTHRPPAAHDNHDVTAKAAIAEVNNSAARAHASSNLSGIWRLATAWSIFASVLLFRLFLGALCLRSIKRASCLADERTVRIADTLRQQLKIHHEVDVRVAWEETRMPVAFWWRGWTICLPSSAAKWEEDLLRSVLAHELGHVARKDAATELLGQLACVAYWFHPLVWLSMVSARRLREQACDDLVLAAAGLPPKDYASHLLDVVSLCSLPRNQLASAIAGASSIETRIRRILDETPRTIPTLLRTRGTTALVLIAVVALSTMRLSIRAAENDSVETNRKAATNVDPEDLVSVRGRVVDDRGTPSPNAEVVLRVIPASFDVNVGLQRKSDFMARTRSDADGHFSFVDVAIPAPYRYHDKFQDHRLLELLVTTPKHGLTYKSFDQGDDDIEIQVKQRGNLVGMVVDPNGEPVRDAIVEVTMIGEADATFDPLGNSPAFSNFFASTLAPKTKTDAQGEFRLQQIPDNSIVGLFVRHPEFAREFAVAVTGGAATPYKIESTHGEIDVLVSPVIVRAKAGRKITLSVVDANGKPMDVVAEAGGRGPEGPMFGTRGRYELTSGESGKHYVKIQVPSSGIRIVRPIELTDDHLQEPYQLEVTVPKTRLISGRVVNDGGEGVARVEVQWSHEQLFLSAARTDAEGTYTMQVVPGEGKLTFGGKNPNEANGVLIPARNTLRRDEQAPSLAVSIPAEAEPVVPDLHVSHGLVLSGVVADSQGKPVAEARVRVRSADYLDPGAAVAMTDSEGRYTIMGLNPRCDYFVFVTHRREVGRVDAVKEDASPPAKPNVNGFEGFETVQIVKDITTQPSVTLTGRVLCDGEPVPQLPVELDVGTDLDGDGTMYSLVASTKTNDNGEYRLAGVLPGESYHVKLKPPFQAIAPGWTHQSPYAPRVPEPLPDNEYELDDANLVRLGQSLAGRVIDPDGNPVEGATVSASMADGRMLARIDSSVFDAPPPWTESDANGRFVLTHLPEEPIRLMAYFSNPEGGRIRFPANVSPELNQQDIEVVLDPSLQEE